MIEPQKVVAIQVQTEAAESFRAHVAESHRDGGRDHPSYASRNAAKRIFIATKKDGYGNHDQFFHQAHRISDGNLHQPVVGANGSAHPAVRRPAIRRQPAPTMDTHHRLFTNGWEFPDAQSTQFEHR